MKTRLILLLLAGFFQSMGYSQDQTGVDSTGLPGDHFSLQAALQLFRESDSPEAFEKSINEEGKHVNNLDLNGDGETDYIRVEDRSKNDLHVMVLQAVVGENDFQDIATIEIEKTGKEEAMLQIIGDEDVYGEEVIIEPTEESEEVQEGKGPSVMADDHMAIIVNVWAWPSVRFIYGPVYRPWVSPFRWRVYPTWWRPWRPLGWRVFHPFHLGYHRHYTVVHTHRTIRARAVYKPHRVTSVTVKTRHSTSIGKYRVTRTKTSHTGPRGNTVTKKTTTVKKGGEVKSKKTTVRKSRH